jgi:general secretion pathway protein H
MTCRRYAACAADPATRARGARRTPRGSRGVTLLELLIVLSIMAVLAALVVPRFTSGVSTSALKGATREIAAGLRLARSEALATRKETRLVLDLEQRAFRVEPDPRVHALPKEIELKLFTAQSDLLSDKVGTVRFFPDGGSNGGRVTLAAGERKYNVDIDWLTGRVAILD